MSASLDKKEIEKVSDRQASLRIIKETAEAMGATVIINWQTEVVKINGPLPDLTYAIEIEAALLRAEKAELYELGGDEAVFISEAGTPEPDETVH